MRFLKIRLYPITGDERYSSVVVDPVFYNQTSIVYKVHFVVGD